LLNNLKESVDSGAMQPPIIMALLVLVT